MTTLAQIEEELPWGFHDANLEALTIDWLAQTLRLTLRLPMTQRQDVERRAEVTVSGLFFCSIDPANPYDRTEEEIRALGLWIDAGEGPAKDATGLPALPTGVFLHHLYVKSWNYQTIHIAGRDARLTWLGEEAPRRGPGGALFPGDEVPDS